MLKRIAKEIWYRVFSVDPKTLFYTLIGEMYLIFLSKDKILSLFETVYYRERNFFFKVLRAGLNAYYHRLSEEERRVVNRKSAYGAPIIQLITTIKR